MVALAIFAIRWPSSLCRSIWDCLLARRAWQLLYAGRQLERELQKAIGDLSQNEVMPGATNPAPDNLMQPAVDVVNRSIQKVNLICGSFMSSRPRLIQRKVCDAEDRTTVACDNPHLTLAALIH